MPAQTLAEMQVLFSADTRAFTQGLNAIQRDLTNAGRSLGQNVTNIGRSITGAGVKMSAAFAPVGLAMFKGIELASEFQDSIKEIGARAGLTGRDLERVSDYALQLGQDTAFSGMQASEALLNLMASGQNLEDAMVTLPQVMDLAAASGENLGSVADGVTNIMASFGYELDALPEVIDALNSAAGASSAGVGDLTAAFGNLGPIASNMGLDIGEASAALAVLNENGIQGAEAGTALKSMLLNMTNDTPAVTAAWEKLGTSFYDVEGNIRDFDTVLDEISIALADMPVEDQNRLLQDLAGSYGTVALQSLLGAGGVDTMLTAMDGVPGAAEIAAARLDTFSGRMDSLKGSVETLMIQAMTPFMDNVLKPIVERLTKVVNAVTDWITENPKLMETIMPIIAGIGVLAVSLIPLGMAFSAAGVAIGVMSGALMLLLSPIGLALVAGGALVAAYLTNFGGFKNFIDNEVRPRLEDFFNFLGDIWTNLQPTIDEFRQGITDAFGTLQNEIIPALQIRWEQFTTWVNELWNKIQPTIALLRTGIETAFNFIKDVVIPALQKRFSDFIDFAGKIWTTIQPTIEAIKGGIETAFNFLKDTVIPALVSGFDDFIKFVGRIWNAISPGIESVKGGIENAFGWVSENVIPPLSAAIKGISTAFEWVANTISGPLDIIKTLIEGAMGAVSIVISGVAGAIADVTTALGGVQGQVGGQIGSGATAANSIIGAAVDYAASLGNASSSTGVPSGGSTSTSFGFASGTPWTGSGSKEQIAGVTHMQEAVVPAGGMQVIPSPRGLMIEGSAGMSGGGGGNIYIEYVSIEGVRDVNSLYDELARVAKQRA